MASVDKPEDNRKFAEKNEATFPILSDPGKDTCEKFGVLSARGYANRWTYYIDPQGIIRRIDKDVDPRTAGEDLVRHLEELDIPRTGAE